MSSRGDSQSEQKAILNPHAQTVATLGHQLDTDLVHGLMKGQVEQRLNQYGKNQLPRIRGSFWQVYLAPILNGLILIYLVVIALLATIVIFFRTPGTSNVIVWIVIIAFNAILAIIQQYRAQKKLEALQSLTADTCIVIREGLRKEIATDELVPGDVVVLAQGDRIPADGRLLDANQLATIEASLTGESTPTMKYATRATLTSDTPLHQRHNMVYSGTHVATGSGRFLVTGTGENTEIGEISQGLETLNTGDIPLRRKVNRLAIFLGGTAIFLAVLGFVSYLLFPRPLDGIILTPAEVAVEAIVNAMTVMPINIPLLTTIVLLTGVLAMAGVGVIVSDLSAVESLGRVSVICTDKTGTLTRSEMMVGLIWDGTHLFQVTGQGYEPKGKIQIAGGSSDLEEPIAAQKVTIENHDQLALLVRIGALNNDAQIIAETNPELNVTQWRAVGDPTEAALLVLFQKTGIPEESLRAAYEIVQDYPFDSRLRRMTRIFTHPEGGYVAFIKGATDVLLPLCKNIGNDRSATRLSSKQRKNIEQYVNDFATNGYRILSFAIRRFNKVPKGKGQALRKTIEKDLTFVGFVCIVDPPREGVREAVLEVADAGIRTIMITGDAAATAKTIGRQLAIVNDADLVIEGKDARNISDDDFNRISVFARVDPEDKQVIVQRYKNAKRAVAVTGDGVNDALALSMSDVGIAMGITGTDVAKEAADMIIADDSYNSIVEGIRQGRGLFSKIRVMIFFYICINVGESILFFGTFLLGIPFLTPSQHIFLTISSHTWPGLALVFDRTARYVMEEKPRDTEAILTRRLGLYLLLNAFLIFLGATIAFSLTSSALLPGNEFLEPYSPLAVQKGLVMTVAVLLFSESLIILSIRRINQSMFRSIRYESYWLIYLLIAVVFIMFAGLMYVPEVNLILASLGVDFQFIPLSAVDWLIAFMLAFPAVFGMELVKWGCRKKGISF
ncbi:MAG: cation-translocating P-type ATPase [Candidatus Thorarchaeota archaeon]